MSSQSDSLHSKGSPSPGGMPPAGAHPNPGGSTPAAENADPNEKSAFRDGLSLEVSASRMRATLQIDREFSARYTPESIESFLTEFRVVSGIDCEAVRRIFTDSQFSQPIAVAKGTPAEPGCDGFIQWEIDLKILDGGRSVEAEGHVDWAECSHILSVKKDQVLGRLIDPTAGTPGADVYGNELAVTPGAPAKFSTGKGVRIADGGKTLYSDLDGVIVRIGDKISVSELLTVNGDVDYGSGNIHCTNSVLISGGVMTGFVVEAGQDIHVNGVVGAAKLTAGGAIFLDGGIHGSEQAVIRAGGDIHAKFINNATLVAGGDIVVTGPITHSTVWARGRVVVTGSKAILLGGHIRSETEIVAGEIGSEMEVKTMVELGFELSKMVDRRTEEGKKLQSVQENHEKIMKAVQVMKLLRDKGKLPEAKQDLHLKMIRMGMQLQAKIKQAEEAIHLLEYEIENARMNQKGITAREVLFPGVRVKILNQILPIKVPTPKVTVALVGNAIEMMPYKG